MNLSMFLGKPVLFDNNFEIKVALQKNNTVRDILSCRPIDAFPPMKSSFASKQIRKVHFTG